jgi:hypothetical protein
MSDPPVLAGEAAIDDPVDVDALDEVVPFEAFEAGCVDAPVAAIAISIWLVTSDMAADTPLQAERNSIDMSRTLERPINCFFITSSIFIYLECNFKFTALS